MPNHNFDKFHEVADKFLHLGWKVINPANNFGGRSDLPREDYMRTDFVSIAKADAIVMLPGWKNSRGATAEYLVAIECGLEVYDAETLRHTEDLPMPSVMLTEDAEPFDSLPDSGSRQQFESGTVRDEASNKPRLELISPVRRDAAWPSSTSRCRKIRCSQLGERYPVRSVHRIPQTTPCRLSGT